MNVTESVRLHASAAPGRPAYVTESGDAIGYAQLERTIELVAGRLLGLGMTPGKTAALALGQVYHSMVVVLALGRIGAAAAPATFPAHLTAMAIVDRGGAGNGCARVVALDEIWPDPRRDPVDPPSVPTHPGSDAAFVVCASSGTTGTPKFTPLTHEVLLRRTELSMLARIYGAPRSPDDRVATFLGPLTAWGAVVNLYTLRSGAAVVEPNVYAVRSSAWLAATRVTHIVLSPITLQRMLDTLPPQRVPNSLAVVEVGGGHVPTHLLDLVRDRLGANTMTVYGTSECGWVSTASAALHRATRGSAGRPTPGVSVEIVDEQGRRVPPGTEGAVRVRSDACVSTYVDNPAATAEVFRDGWVYPGDRGVLSTEGMLRLVGREDDVINRGGAKINPAALEETLMALGGLREVAVFGVPGAGFTTICAAVVPEASFDGGSFLARCREKLGTNAPAFVMGVHALPRNENGKVLRRELGRIATEASARAQAAGAEPRG